MPIRGVPATILVAPDAFKGTFSAAEVAEAIGRGLTAAARTVDLCPIADGGEGTLEVLLEPLSLELRSAAVSDPLGRQVEASFGIRGKLAVVESAAASGLSLVAPGERDPIRASTHGTGELIVAAVGAGAIRAIRAAGGLGRGQLVVLCDVRTAFEDAARVFGPQKGSDEGDVRRLTRRLHDLARRLPRDPRGVPMSGAAGGLAGGLWAAFGAELAAGAPFVLDAIGFDSRMRAARAVLTGEGKLDSQSLAGKAVSEVATRARQAGVPCHAIVGVRELDSFGARVLDLQAIVEARTTAEIERAAERLADVI